MASRCSQRIIYTPAALRTYTANSHYPTQVVTEQQRSSRANFTSRDHRGGNLGTLLRDDRGVVYCPIWDIPEPHAQPTATARECKAWGGQGRLKFTSKETWEELSSGFCQARQISDANHNTVIKLQVGMKAYAPLLT